MSLFVQACVDDAQPESGNLKVKKRSGSKAQSSTAVVPCAAPIPAPPRKAPLSEIQASVGQIRILRKWNAAPEEKPSSSDDLITEKIRRDLASKEAKDEARYAEINQSFAEMRQTFDSLKQFVLESLKTPKRASAATVIHVDTDTSLLRLDQVLAMTGHSRATIYRWIKQGVFPAGIKTGSKSKRWPRTDIEKWVAERKAAIGNA